MLLILVFQSGFGLNSLGGRSMPIFKIDLHLTTSIVVSADNEHEAYMLAQDHALDCIRDAEQEAELVLMGEITSLEQLSDGWDATCIPYGAGSKRLKDLLPV
jgi:hypothetical protein